MWCSCCQSAWYCTSEHLHSVNLLRRSRDGISDNIQDWPPHPKECVLATHTPNCNIFATPPAAEQQVITGSVVLFSSEEGRPNIITVKCCPSGVERPVIGYARPTSHQWTFFGRPSGKHCFDARF
ncbi:hypothetical protein EV702DRAFT_1108223 [Suillus placidus]|uniref:Uncharacterized protein n=1 Tax=Suillus placidus TaxID=48579 RepID=A0A9P6ZUY9_9AGAM|nr:hypothetical protein EV702DRAFT_1108223 [Suillus placidus]